MIQWMIAKFILRQALAKLWRDVRAHVKNGGWNQKVSKVKETKNYRGRFEPEPSTPIRVQTGERDMSGQQIAGFVRHILTFAGGWVVAQGYVDESMMMEFSGAAATIAGLVWSWWSKTSQPQV